MWANIKMVLCNKFKWFMGECVKLVNNCHDILIVMMDILPLEEAERGSIFSQSENVS